MLQGLLNEKKYTGKGGESRMRVKHIAIIAMIVGLFLASAAYAQTTFQNGQSQQIITVSYTYNSVGQLTGQTQTITENGKDMNGGTFNVQTTVNYNIFNGLAKISKSTSLSKSNGTDGSYDETTSTVNYNYTNGQLSGATGTRSSSGNGEKVNNVASEKYTSTSTLTYAIIAGQAVVSKDVTTTNTTKLGTTGGTYNPYSTTVTTTDYTYASAAGELKVASTTSDSTTTRVETDPSGKKLFSHTKITTTYNNSASGGFLTSASASGTGDGYEFNGSSGYQTYTSTIVQTMGVVNGNAKVTKYTETKNLSTPMDNSSLSLLTNAWSNFNLGTTTGYNAAITFANQVISTYKNTALQQQAALTSEPSNKGENWALNDVATAYWILAESQRLLGQTATAKTNYQYIVSSLKWGYCYDPATNSYWNVATAAQGKINSIP